VTTFAAGQTLTAAMLTELQSYAIPLSAMKSSTTSRNTTTSVTADPHLSLTIPAGQSYDFQLNLLITSDANAAGDFLGQLSWTGTATLNAFGASGLVNTLASGSTADLEAPAGSNDSTSPGAPFAFGASTTTTLTVLTGRITTTTAALLTLDWAQFSSNASNTNLLIGSTFVARRRS
jgi:hypothetical protein